MGTEDMGRKKLQDGIQNKFIFLIGALKPFNIIWEKNRCVSKERGRTSPVDFYRAE